MLLGLISLWPGGAGPTPTPHPAPPGVATNYGPSGFMVGGKPVTYIPKKRKGPFPDREIEEDELEELLAMLGIDL